MKADKKDNYILGDWKYRKAQLDICFQESLPTCNLERYGKITGQVLNVEFRNVESQNVESFNVESRKIENRKIE